MKNFLFSTLLLMLPFSMMAQQEYRVLSPDGLTYLNVKLADGRLTYNAGYRTVVKAKKKGAVADTLDVPMILESPLGLYTSVGDFSKGLEYRPMPKNVERLNQKHEYTLRQGKQSKISSEENTLLLCFTNPEAKAKKLVMWVLFNVFNNNIAYCYRICQEQGSQTSAVVVTGEASGFRLPTDATAFICPQSDPMIGWMQTKPSYEEGYIWDEPITKRSGYGHGWTFPCLFREGDKGWVLISETGVSSSYCGSHLSDATSDGLFTIAFPMEGENNGFGSTGAQMGLADSHVSPNDKDTQWTPYRTITFGRTLKPIVETTITWDVVEPLYEPSIDYKGSRNTWSWIIWQDASINYDDQVKFIDLAASLGWEGCLIDGGWYENIGREGMEKLFAYCKQKGVRPWVWYNSNGGWNNAPQTARQCMHNSIVRKKEMKWLHDNGVAGIKVDFFGGDKQETMRLYEGLLSDANDFGIQVICHGCTLPRGWEKMYPNYCSSEAVLASENLYFSQGFCDMEARHACLHPFVRNAVGSMEYGGTVLQKRLHKEPGKGNTRRTTDVFELATAIVFQSSGQNFALTPRNLTEQPQFEIDFMKQVPTTWDETRFIDGYPGKYVVLARRHADNWYIAALNAQKEPLNLTLNINGYHVKTLLVDEAPQPMNPDKKGNLNITIQPSSGAVLY
ncbi:MAG: glycoside hydrolase family 97 catalytic domain-containing protein [Bacteroidaceae bacterium]|nr:glycoside hydrolase family 97 catalytic domain-containing protein [Bacteroidaceae bacterium]